MFVRSLVSARVPELNAKPPRPPRSEEEGRGRKFVRVPHVHDAHIGRSRAIAFRVRHNLHNFWRPAHVHLVPWVFHI